MSRNLCASSGYLKNILTNILRTADRREFLRISQAVGMGFLIMGVIGYVVKLSTWLKGGSVDEFES